MTPPHRGENRLVVEGSAGRDLIASLSQVVQNFNNTNIINIPSLYVVPATILILLIAGAFYILLRSNDPSAPTPMKGDFNIAIAEFKGTGSKISTGRAFSQMLFDMLDTEYQQINFRSNDFEVQIEHDDIGTVSSFKDAEELAEHINADMVIFGTVTVVNGNATVIPKFYVSESLKLDAGEITGLQSLASPIQFREDDLLEGSTNIGAKSKLVIEFAKGLSYMVAGDFQEAASSFGNAIDQSGGETFAGKEALYLAASTNAIFLEKLAEAQNYLDEIFELNKNYGRAYIGQGNLFYVQAKMTWDAGNITGAQEAFSSALASYQEAANLADQASAALLEEKANVSIGNIYAFQYQVASDNDKLGYATLALEHYRKVIDAYAQSRIDNMREIAALAYYGSGIVYQGQGEFQSAQLAFQQTLSLSRNQDLRDRAKDRLEAIQG